MIKSKNILMSMGAAAALAVTGCASTDGGMGASAGADASASTPASAPVTVGGAAMLPTNNIVENAKLANNFTTLVAAVESAGLGATLSGPGPFTVFAPTDDAFARLGQATIDSLMQPEMSQQLGEILKYHVVAGEVTAEDLMEQIEAGGGQATIGTVNGAELTASLEAGNVKLTDVRGNAAYVTTADAKASNGVVHEINGVLLPTPAA
ncbi:fasciclin domain-containing protein [Pacificimonas sp. ICDLI1SI03]